MDLVKLVEMEQMKKKLPDFRVGDSVKVHHKVVEGGKERTQIVEGIVIARKGSGLNANFTIRRLSHGVGVERTFPIHSPRVDKVEIVKKGHVRRAKLFYLRKKIGKAAKVKEKKA